MAQGYHPGLDPLPIHGNVGREATPNWVIPSALIAVGLLGHGSLKLLESIAKRRGRLVTPLEAIPHNAPKMKR